MPVFPFQPQGREAAENGEANGYEEITVGDASSMKYELLTVQQIREIYSERLVKDFAPDEVKSLRRILTALSAGHYACYGAAEENEIVAYAFFVIDGRNALIDYFAVREDLRGCGKGSRFLRMMAADLLQRFDCVLLESEDPDYGADEEECGIRERRLRFYMHNNLAGTGVRAEVWHVHYRILVFPLGRIPPDDEVRKIYASIYRVMLPERLYRKMVHI